MGCTGVIMRTATMTYCSNLSELISQWICRLATQQCIRIVFVAAAALS